MHQKKRAGAKGSRSECANQAEVVGTFLASGTTVAEVARHYGLAEQTVRDWIRQASDEAIQARSTAPERSRRRGQAAPEPAWIPEIADSEIEYALAEALDAVRRAEAAETAARTQAAKAVARGDAAEAEAREARARTKEAEAKAADAMARTEAAGARARAEVVEAVAKAAKAAKALVRAQKKAAEAVARAEAAAESEAAIRAEITGVYAAAVEAIIRSEVAAQEASAEAERAAAARIAEAEAAANQAVARAEQLAAEAKAQAEVGVAARADAEAAVRVQIAAVHAEAVEAIVRAEVVASERVANAEAALAGALAMSEERALQDHASDSGEALTEDEAAARAEIAALVSRLQPVEVWVQGVGRSLAEARQVALEQLRVDESEAEFEVLDKGARWLPGRVRVRARIRVPEAPAQLVRPARGI